MISCVAVAGLPEIRAGNDLASLVAGAVDLVDGDVVVVTSKVVSKAEGRVVDGDRQAALASQTRRVVARRGPTTIVRTRSGLVMAAAGVDASNTAPGTLVLLPEDPDASARALREGFGRDHGPNVAVLVSDTAGRAWRVGQTDLAVGAAGIEVLDRYAGREDGYGNVLAVTAPAVADEITAAADLVKRKLGRTPVAVVRGLADRVLPRGDHGPGAAALVRPETEDLFGLGSREAVVQALLREDDRGFGSAASASELVTALARAVPEASVEGEADAAGGAAAVHLRLPVEDEPGPTLERVRVLCFAFGWEPAGDGGQPEDPRAGRSIRLQPRLP